MTSSTNTEATGLFSSTTKTPGPLERPPVESESSVQRLPIIEESLRVEKKAVDTGGLRITKRVETRDQQVDELLHSEHIEIERRPVNVPIADDAIPATRREGDTLIVPVIEETLITVKQLVLIEEVRITTTRQTHRTAQTVSLRKEHLDVERLAAKEAFVGQVNPVADA